MAALLIFLCGASVFFTVGRQFQVRTPPPTTTTTHLPAHAPASFAALCTGAHAAPQCTSPLRAQTAARLCQIINVDGPCCRPTWCP